MANPGQLPEEYRGKLDNIVSKMETDGVSEGDILSTVEDFKKKYTLPAMMNLPVPKELQGTPDTYVKRVLSNLPGSAAKFIDSLGGGNDQLPVDPKTGKGVDPNFHVQGPDDTLSALANYMKGVAQDPKGSFESDPVGIASLPATALALLMHGGRAAVGTKTAAVAKAGAKGAIEGTPILGKAAKRALEEFRKQNAPAPTPSEAPTVPNVGGTAQIPSQLPAQPLTATPPIPQSPLSTYMSRGSTVGPLTKAPMQAATAEVAPLIERDLLTGKMLPKGVKATEKLAEDVKELTPTKIQEALAKVKARQETEAAKQKLLDMMLPKKP